MVCRPRFIENLPDFQPRRKHTLSTICQSIPGNRPYKFREFFSISQKESAPFGVEYCLLFIFINFKYKEYNCANLRPFRPLIFLIIGLYKSIVKIAFSSARIRIEGVYLYLDELKPSIREFETYKLQTPFLLTIFAL